MTLPSARSLSSSASSFVAVNAGLSAMSGVVDTVRLYLRGWVDGRVGSHAVYSGTNRNLRRNRLCVFRQ